MVRFSGGFALAIVLSVVCAAAVDESGFLVEMSDTNISKVKTANYYGYGQTELSCLSQLNFKSCRLVEFQNNWFLLNLPDPAPN
jgi:hypothetical protein